MATPRKDLFSFSSGLISQTVAARSDFGKSASGLLVAENVLIEQTGAVSNRSGFYFIGHTRKNEESRLIPFSYDGDNKENYILEFTNKNIRVYREGAPVFGEEKTITDISSASVALLTCPSHGLLSGDEIMLFNITSAPDLTKNKYTAVVVDTNTLKLKDVYGKYVSTLNKTFVGSRGKLRPYYSVETPYLSEALSDLFYDQDNDVLIIVSPNYPPKKLTRYADNDWRLEDLAFSPSNQPPAALDGYAISSLGGGLTITPSFKITAINGSGESQASTAIAVEVPNVEDGRRLRFSWAPVSGATLYRLYRSDLSIGAFATTSQTSLEIIAKDIRGDGATPPTTGDPGAPSTPTGFFASVIFGEPLKYKVSSISESSGEESLPSSGKTIRNDLSYKGNKNIITWDDVAGSSAYVIYKYENGRYGYIGTSETTLFEDENITADFTRTPKESFNPFDSENNYPSTCAFIANRFVAANTKNNPSAVYASQVGNFQNFSSSDPATPSDSFSIKLKGASKIRIHSLVDIGGIGVLSNVGEWLIKNKETDLVDQQSLPSVISKYGASKLPPIKIGNNLLFIEDNGKRIREYAYDLQSDGYKGRDLTILCEDLFKESTIIRWCYAKYPLNLIICVLSDGRCAAMTYVPDQDIYAWTLIATSGKIIDCAVCAEKPNDAVYFTVVRTINTKKITTIEKLSQRNFTDITKGVFLDCCYQAIFTEKTSKIYGLYNLENELITVFADGRVYKDLRVSGGKITLPTDVTIVAAGIPYSSSFKTNRVYFDNMPSLGSSTGRTVSIRRAVLTLKATVGIKVGVDFDNLIEAKTNIESYYDYPVKTSNEIVQLDLQTKSRDSGYLCVKQEQPLPMTVIAVALDCAISE